MGRVDMIISVSAILAAAGITAALGGLVAAVRQEPRGRTPGGSFVMPRRGATRPRRRIRLVSRLRTRTARRRERFTEDHARHALLVRRNFALSSVAFGVGSAGLYYTPLLIGGAALSTVAMAPVLVAGLAPLLRRGRVDIGTLDALIFVVCVGNLRFFLMPWCAFVVHLSRFLILRSEDATYRRLGNALGDGDRMVWVLENGTEFQVPLARVRAGDLVVVDAGETVPVDGRVMSGFGLVNKAALTGEEVPDEVSAGSVVHAASIVSAGRLTVRTENTGPATIAARLSALLEQTDDYRETVQARGEAHANQVSPPTFWGGVLVLPFLGFDGTVAVWNSVPGYMFRVVAPVGALSHLSQSLDDGVLIRDGRVLDFLFKVDTVILDKTGTVTTGGFHEQGVHVSAGWTRHDVLCLAATAEHHQTHPLAEAIRTAAAAEGVVTGVPDWVEIAVGRGLRAVIAGRQVCLGSLGFLAEAEVFIDEAARRATFAHFEDGHTVVGLAVDGALAGVIALAPIERPGVRALVRSLRRRGMAVYLMSGDGEESTRHMAERIGASGHFSEKLPQDKAKLVKSLQDNGRTVCFVGDGINDAVALRQAHVSVSFHGATPLALDSAHVVLLQPDLDRLRTLLNGGLLFEARMLLGRSVTVLPSIISMGAALFLGSGLITSILLNQAGLWTGLVAAARPVALPKRLSGEPIGYGAMEFTRDGDDLAWSSV